MDEPSNGPRVEKFKNWLNQNFVFSLLQGTAALDQAEKKMRIAPSLLADEGHRDQMRDGWQARAAKVIHAAERPSAAAHVRKRLDEWRMSTLPGRRPVRWINNLERTARLLPPRVQACQLRTAWSGWTTARLKGNATCMYGCPRSKHSIEHYALCKRYHDLCRKCLGISQPPVDACLDDFVGVRPWVQSLPAHCRGTDEVAAAGALRAIANYALYRSYNAVGHDSCIGDGMAVFRTYIR